MTDEIDTSNERVGWIAEMLEALNADARAVLALRAERDALRQRAEEAQAEVAELKAIIARIDEVVPSADQTCDEPGITLSEAVRRERAALRQDEGGE